MGRTLSSFVPPGMIKPHAGFSVPLGYLACDGSEVSRSTYSDLFSAIGTSFGGGDGYSTFNLPDLRSRTPIGEGAGPGLSYRSLGQSLGEEYHTLSAAELAPHTHSGTTGTDYPDHAHQQAMGDKDDLNCSHSGGQNALADGPNLYATGSYTFGASARHQHNFGTNGGDGVYGYAHNNMQPSLCVKFIIKY